MDNPLQLSLQTFRKGSYIIVEGKQKADYFYIIRNGKVRLSKEVEIVEEVGGNVLSPGDFFGVVSTMSSHSHIETAQALTDCALITVHREQYGLLIERNAPVAMKIIQQFSQKMRFLDEALTQITFKTTATDDISHLFKVAEYYARQSQYNQAYYAYHQYIKYAPGGENINTAKERMAKIKPYAKVVYLDGDENNFTRSYPKDTMIFSESQPGQELYIIQKGSVKITKIVNDNEQLLALLKPGDIFGEMSLLENKPRSASAIAHDETVLMAVNNANFNRMVASQPQIISKLTQLLSERIWFIYKQLANTQLTDPLGRLYDALLIQLEKLRVPVGTQAYTFDFGPQELINLVGLSKDEGNVLIRKLFENSKVKVLNNKIHLTSTEEVEKQAKYYRKMERIDKSRKKGSINNF
ncbi:MAG: cyclic nucleotide-binding domain-containing protein [Spirochaetales bacterium]|uniref:Cyclic nucleotide-binding domain-containing protein n=1 Tax=Candidatus Thalassospirochaeta sargassi TaxID=3119039 RepID=A0AAJ1MJH1_9SPIO|nr:cyclic nucleotide-binding domain-containing protein [Spirochaetales bacterium]